MPFTIDEKTSIGEARDEARDRSGKMELQLFAIQRKLFTRD
jgi:hypothetical protein